MVGPKWGGYWDDVCRWFLVADSSVELPFSVIKLRVRHVWPTGYLWSDTRASAHALFHPSPGSCPPQSLRAIANSHTATSGYPLHWPGRVTSMTGGPPCSGWPQTCGGPPMGWPKWGPGSPAGLWGKSEALEELWLNASGARLLKPSLSLSELKAFICLARRSSRLRIRSVDSFWNVTTSSSICCGLGGEQKESSFI